VLGCSRALEPNLPLRTQNEKTLKMKKRSK
jgi:hypothetical protein